MMTIDIDSTDPMTAVTSWILTMIAASYMVGPKFDKYRKALPFLAVLIAVFLRVVYTSSVGQPLDWQVLLRAVASGAIAVLVHSQFRELLKLSQPTTTQS